MTKKPKLVILQNHPTQCHAPRYKALAEFGTIDVKAVYLTDAGAKEYLDPGFSETLRWDVPLLEGYDYTILQPGTGITARSFWDRYDRSLTLILEREQPNWILVDGYASRMDWVAVRWASRNGIRVAYSSDTNGRIMRNKLRDLAKRPFLRWYFSKIDAFFSPSEANQEFLAVFSVSKARIHQCPYSIDADRYLKSGRDIRDVDFIWAGKLIPRKRPHDFVQALRELKARGYSSIRAKLLGNGILLDELRKGAIDLTKDDVLTFEGFVNQARMAEELGCSQIFVFTSEDEPYGVVATEAAAAGAALVVAAEIGCVGPDSSAQPNINTLVYPVGDVRALADAMERLLIDKQLLHRMQSASRLIGGEHNVTQAARIMEKVFTNV